MPSAKCSDKAVMLWSRAAMHVATGRAKISNGEEVDLVGKIVVLVRVSCWQSQ